MRNFVTIVFDDSRKAYKGLHALWLLDAAGEITVHGTAVVHRDEWGHFEVDTKETHPVFATAAGVGIGALLGALAGPAGMAIGAASGAALGATVGAVIGSAVDVTRFETRDEADAEAGFVLERGHSAVIADVTEDWPANINTQMRSIHGVVYRRSKSSVENDATYNDNLWPHQDYLYPYEYTPSRYAYYGW